MTQKEAIAMAGAVRHHDLPEALLVHFLGELEGRIATDIRGERAEREISAVQGRQLTLSVPYPFDRLYWTHLVAMIDLAAGDTAAYQSSLALFREAFDAYARHYQRTGGRG